MASASATAHAGAVFTASATRLTAKITTETNERKPKMNLTAFDVYLVSLVGDLAGMLGIVAGMSVITCIIFLIKYFDDVEYRDEKAKRDLKYVTRSATVVGVSIFLATITPSKETLAAMYIIPAAANSEFVSKDLPDAGKQLIKAAVKWMEHAAGQDDSQSETDK